MTAASTDDGGFLNGAKNRVSSGDIRAMLSNSSCTES